VTIGVLALQGDFREHMNMIRSLGVQVQLVRFPEEVALVDGLIIPGGESTTIGKLMVKYGLDRAIIERFTAGRLALYGTCAGMIVLARNIEGNESQPHLGIAGRYLCVEMRSGVRRNQARRTSTLKAWIRPFTHCS